MLHVPLVLSATLLPYLTLLALFPIVWYNIFMKRIPKIIVLYFLFIIPAALAAITIGVSAEPIDLPPHTWERALANFDKRWREYQESPPAPQAVLIGPSYGVIGRVKGVRNLALGSMRPTELNELLRQCRPQDTILIAMTFVDAIPHPTQTRPRKDFHNPSLRRLSISRAALLPMRATPFERPDNDLSKVDLYNLKRAFPPPLRLNIVGDQLTWFSPTDLDAINMARYEKIHQQYPNVIFLLFPTYPFSTDTIDCDIVARAIRFCDASDYFQSLFDDIPHIDLSDTLGVEHFLDLFHYTNEGKEIIRERIHEIAVNDLPGDSTRIASRPIRP